MKNFLSKLWSLSRADRVRTLAIDAVSLPSFCRVKHVLTLLVVMLFTIGSGNVWGDSYTLTFKTGSGDGTSMSTSTSASTCLSGGSDYVTGNLATASNVYHSGDYGLKVGKKSGAGDIKINLSTDGQVVPTKVSVYAKYYSSKNIKTVQVCTNLGSNTATTTTGSFAEYSYSYSGSTKLSYIEIKSSGYIWVEKVVVTYAAPAASVATPTFSPVAGTYEEAQSVTISCATTGTTIYYTTDGSTPTSSSPAYSSAVSITGSCTLKAIAKKGSDYSSVGSAAYVIKKKVNWSVNGENWNTGHGSPTTRVVAGNKVTALPTAPTSAACDGSKVFVGWTTSEYSHASTAPTTLFTTAAGAPNVDDDVTYYAVFADAADGSSSKTYELTIERGDVPSAYAGTWSAKTATETGGGSGTLSVSLSGTNVMQSTASGHTTHIQFKASSTGFYNTTDLGTINSITTNNSDIKYYINSSSNPSSSGSGGYFRVYNSTSGARYTASIVINFTKTVGGTTYSNYTTTCCTDPGLAYGTAPVTRTFGDAAFTNPLTNSHSVAVTYSSSDETVATVDSEGEVTILKVGSTTITASSAAQTVAAVSYCADEASYTLTVNKANISPTLSYTPNSVAVGENSSAPTVGGNPGSGGVTYAITSATPSGCATINTSTGVVSGVAVGSVTVTATVAATTNYNGGSATANVTITAASGYCISAFNSSNNGITSGFSNGGSGNEYTLNYTIPGKDGSSNWPQYWIGENEAYKSFSASANFADMHFTHSDATLGLAEGATGKLHIWDDNKASGSNLWVKFEPDGYGLRWGGAGEWDQAANTKAFTVDAGDANVYWTDIVTLDGTNNTTWNYYVGLQTASGYVYSGVDNEASDSRGISRTRSVTAMKVSNGTAGSWKGTYLSSEPTGSRGKFRIWNNNIDDYNFYCHWVPFYRVTYDGSGASGSTAASADVCCEGNAAARTVLAAANGFTVPTGKSFGGWASSPENAAAGVVAYAAGADVVLTSSITLYAIWTDINYTVTVNQNPAAGATTTGQTSSAHYNGTINLTVTDIPSGYRFVNWTTSDGFSITNPTSATTASFTMPAKNVTVTANFQQTHTVDWYVGGSAPANKIGDDGQTTVVDHGGKISDFPAHDPDGSACDKTFVGWTNTSSYVHGTSPLFNDVAGSPTINADANFYAVFAEVTGGTDYEQVTSLDDIHDGPAYFAYYGSYSGSRWYGVNSVSTITAPVTVSEGVLTTSTGDYTLTEFTIVTVDAANHIYYIKIGDDYVIGSSSGSNTDLSLDDAPYAWTFESINSTTYNMQISHTYTTPSTTCYMKAGVGTATGGKFRSYPTTGQQISLFQTTESFTGHTINCADCGTSVTPTYTASPTGGTVSVTKSAAAVASGSTVKTCTSVDLTVTITPASHYTLTGFTATGLSTGTATISPAVGSTLPKTTETTFTVTVSAGATGTLNLTPTFTPETPLTITLSTNSKGTFTNPDPWPIYSGESFTFPDVTPNDPSCATFVGWIEGTTFVGDRTTHDAPTGLITAGTVSAAQTSNTTYTAVFYETETAESDAYVKVTEAPVAPATWANDHYLIVYEDGGVAFDGSLSTLDASSNTVAVSISSGAIAATSALAASEWKIALISGSNYSIQSASGKYIGNASNSNGLTADNTALGNTLSISSENFGVVSAGGAYLRYNATSEQERFRYYKSSTYSSQQAIQLYKLGTAVVETRTYTTNPACTPKYRVTVASVIGGSPNANPKFLPEGEEVTLTANPAAGYSFTGWTITKTTGGNDVTTTLLGANATTANTSFSMPAYDVTVTASYAKIPVASLQVKDGETVIANSGTVNISTGANKTLTVVVTPADAFDHSWSASVTGGDTYASITNVQAGTFQVNGLAQGDATITVTAPNDGDAKTVTFTVHVTDILPTEVVLKRDGSNTSISELSIYEGQYVKVNVSFTPTPTNKDFSVSADGTFVTIHAQAHTNPNYYATLNGKKVTTSPVNVTFTSAATSSVTKNLVVTVLPLLTDTFVDYIHGQATQTVSARLSVDKFTLYTDINTPSLSDASDADPTSADCETSHYHLIGWLPKATAEALWAAGTAITESTEGLVKAGVQVEATGQTWYAIWGKEQ